jgi:menaquinone-dependent protoporphyrinogen oxidase
MAHILIAYTTKKGSTAEIAQFIGKELQAAGHAVDVAEIGTVTSLAGYNAAVIGGPMYMGKMIGDTGKFVRHHYKALVRMPVAGFIVSLAPVSKDPVGIEYARKALQAALSPLQPVARTVFAGKLDPAKLSWLQKWMVEKAKSPVGDFRDWTVIATWARELPGKLDV